MRSCRPESGLGADSGLAEVFDQVPSIATGRLSVTELPGGATVEVLMLP